MPHTRPSLIERETRQFELRAHIFQARDLTPADSNGLADPHISIYCCGKKGKTKRKEECLNPMWYETVCLDVEISDTIPPPDLHLVCRDTDKGSMKATILGQISIPMKEVGRKRRGKEGLLFCGERD